jgi:hypothetical protein
MSINPPRMSGGSCRLGRSGGGQVPPVGLNPPVGTPSKDPIDSLGTLVSASQTSPASGPIRPVRSSPSPVPYDTGFETPHAQQMSSASQAASTSARRQGTMSPSPAPSYALTPIAPMSEGGGGSPFMSLGSPTPSATGEGWRRPEQYAGALRTDAAWLNKFRSGGFGELSEADKLHVADGVGSLIQAAHDASVLYWPSKAMETVMEQILASTGEEEENHSTHYDQDVDMRPPPPLMAWPGPSTNSHGCPPRGAHPLPRPPVGGQGEGPGPSPSHQSHYPSSFKGVVRPDRPPRRGGPLLLCGWHRQAGEGLPRASHQAARGDAESCWSSSQGAQGVCDGSWPIKETGPHHNSPCPGHSQP